MGVLGEVGHEAELDLGVVGGEEGVVLVGGDEGFADEATAFGADGDVLQVRLGRAEASGGYDALLEGGVQPFVVCADECAEFVYIGGFEFFEFSIVEEGGDDGVFFAEFAEGLFVGDVLSFGGFGGFLYYFHLIKKDLPELLGGVDVEGGLGGLVNLGGELLQVLGEVLVDVFEDGGVEGYAFCFHLYEDGDEGHLYVVEEVGGVVFVEGGLELLIELEGEVGVFAGVGGEVVEGYLSHAFLVFSFFAD